MARSRRQKCSREPAQPCRRNEKSTHSPTISARMSAVGVRSNAVHVRFPSRRPTERLSRTVRLGGKNLNNRWWFWTKDVTPPSFGRSNRTARDGIPLGLHRTHGEGRERRGGPPKREAIHRGPHETPSGDAGCQNREQILDGSGSSGNRLRFRRVPVTFRYSRIGLFFMKVSDARARSRVGLPGNHSRGEPG
jgi:hypothetical protein